MIALVMGLIISLAVVALGKSATQTFHDQARLSATESGVRTAVERLRTDLTRISQMAPGNIRLDPQIARINNGGPPSPWRYQQFAYLAGVRIDMQSLTAPSVAVPFTANAATPANFAIQGAGTNNFRPDTIVITGNLTSNDSYGGTFQHLGGACGGGQNVTLDALSDAAVFSLLTGAANPADAQARASGAFLPVAGREFYVQVRDGLGCFHYATVCGTTGISATQVRVDLSNDDGGIGRAVLLANPTAGDPEAAAVPPGVGNGTSLSSCGTSSGGRVRIAPVARARWVVKATHTTRAAATVAEQNYEGQKFDLVREILDATGAAAWSETVLEYAIDLKFGITVDPAPLGGGPLLAFDFDDPNIPVWAGPTAGQLAGQPGPQRIRSIRYRVSARTSTPDRKSSGVIPGGYPIRYCTDPPACLTYARIRTIVSEVALLNQARMLY